MRFDRKFVAVLGLSLIWALIVSVVFYRLAGASMGRPRTAEQQKPVVVAVRPLPIGAMLNREAVKIRQVPESLFPPGGFSRIEEVLERPVISPIQAGEPIVSTRIAALGSGAGLAPLIPAGKRAISVRVNDVVGVAGFVLPGMRVDVLVTGRPPNQADTITRTVLQNITVLSAGQTIQTDGKSPAINTPVVTLLVNPEEAEALTLANNEGHIQLVLRNSTDGQVGATHGRRLHELFGTAVVVDAAPPAAPKQPRRAATAASGRSAPPPPPAKAPDPVQPAAEQVVVIRGSVKTVEAAPVRSGEGK